LCISISSIICLGKFCYRFLWSTYIWPSDTSIWVCGLIKRV
jgi:hypothetical protein